MSGPVKTFKDKGVQVAVWPTSNGGYSYSIGKRYKDKQGEWKDSKYLFKGDVEALLPLLQQAMDYGATREAHDDAAIASPPGLKTDFVDDDLPF